MAQYKNFDTYIIVIVPGISEKLRIWTIWIDSVNSKNNIGTTKGASSAPTIANNPEIETAKIFNLVVGKPLESCDRTYW